MQKNNDNQIVYPAYDGKDPQTYVNQIMELLHHPPDLICRKLSLSANHYGYCIFIESLVDKNKIEHELLRYLSEGALHGEWNISGDLLNTLQDRIPISSVSVTADSQKCVQSLLLGSCLLVITGNIHILVIDTSQTPHRSISQPLMESTIQGPQEGFTEDITSNLSLLRKRIKTVQFRIEEFIIGTETETKICLLYLGDLASIAVVDEFRKRISSIQIDCVLDSSYIEEWIEDKNLSLFPTLLKTERPDVLASHLLEGRIGLIVDGTPDVLIGPVTFFQYFISSEDYYQRPGFATLLRWLRVLSFMLSVFVPAIYIAVVSYHQELLPSPLLISISAQREGVPFPAFIEASIMMVTFEVLREASLRMPRIAGQAISFVGALVLGQAAVEAGSVSASMVIVVAITAISNFVVPFYSFGITQRLLHYFYMALAGFMGLFGILCGVLFIVVYLASIKSFGVPYLSPVAPIFLADWKDILIRIPRPWMKTYPQMNQTTNRKRKGRSLPLLIIARFSDYANYSD
ncbi:spore germination protein [Paenibacillus sp.]|uniref:spore germination protein n=1 Tax=Paenibacillus sp. TaxID=58172 RepID=UPI0028A9349B|nr:spore germination protein [Paenibacillus sp.]